MLLQGVPVFLSAHLAATSSHRIDRKRWGDNGIGMPPAGLGIEPQLTIASNIAVSWGISSIGRVRRLQRRGTGIETRILHSF